MLVFGFYRLTYSRDFAFFRQIIRTESVHSVLGGCRLDHARSLQEPPLSRSLVDFCNMDETIYPAKFQAILNMSLTLQTKVLQVISICLRENLYE